MKRVSAVLLVLAILVVGFLAGVVATHLFYAQRFERAGSVAMMASEFFADRLERDLDLTAEQRASIDAILEQTRSRAAQLRDEMRPLVDELMEGAAERISEVLTDEQRRRFAELRERHRGRSQHFFLGPPLHHGPRRPPWRDRDRGHDRFGPGAPADQDDAPRPPDESTPDSPDES